MALYKATKNIFFTSLNKSVIVDEIIDLEKEYAEAVNADLKPVFTDVEAVLVLVDEEDKLQNAELDSKPDTEAASDAMN